LGFRDYSEYGNLVLNNGAASHGRVLDCLGFKTGTKFIGDKVAPPKYFSEIVRLVDEESLDYPDMVMAGKILYDGASVLFSTKYYPLMGNDGWSGEGVVNIIKNARKSRVDKFTDLFNDVVRLTMPSLEDDICFKTGHHEAVGEKDGDYSHYYSNACVGKKVIRKIAEDHMDLFRFNLNVSNKVVGM